MELSNEIIRKFKPCYDPSSVAIPDGEVLSVKEWVNDYRDIVKAEADIVWLLCRNAFMSDRDLRLFAVWCAREVLKLAENPDVRSIEACNVAERFANGDATEEELSAAMSAARSAAMSATGSAARSAAMSAARSAAMSATGSAAMSATGSAARSAAWSAAWSAAMSATRSAAMSAAWSDAWSDAESAQVDKLLTYFE